MPILIDDADLERRLVAIGDAHPFPVPTKATVAQFLLSAAAEAHETGDITRLVRMLQLDEDTIRHYRTERRSRPFAWLHASEGSTNDPHRGSRPDGA